MTERRPHSDWLEIEPILDRLLELPSGDREEALTGLSASLRAQIEPLLEDIDGEETDLRGLLVSRFGQLVEADQTALEAPQLPGLGPGARLGVYRLERSLGRGGMGEVFLAKRVDGQFEQTVAIKIIRGDVEAAKVRDRFLLERQILAHLQHPGIARLLDGGLSAAGVPFYVMEYVEGEPITEYCDRRRLDVDARLRLFQQVCAAVRYAHQNLVVHRDLKPSNVLVTESGAVKLLDFGIAKLLGGSRSSLTTYSGGALLTPQYAAPEQIRGETISTATDVYALGLLLYELLTGTRPYTVGRVLAEAQRIVTEVEPRRPSTVARHEVVVPVEAAAAEPDAPSRPAADTADAKRRADCRQLSPRRLGQRLRGDLDSIVLKALRKESGRRYPGVDALVQDLELHLAGHPIIGTDSDVLYRLGKVVRRHRFGVAGAVIAVTVLVGALVLVWHQSQVAAVERDRAVAAEQQAGAINRFLVQDLLALASPDVAHGGELSVREMLRSAEQGLEQRLGDQPEVEAEVRSALGTSYLALGDFADARRHLEIARELFSSVYGGAAPQTLAAETKLAEVELRAGDATASRARLEHVLAVRGSRESDDLLVLEAESLLGEVLIERGERLAAERLLRSCLERLGADANGAVRLRLTTMKRLVLALQEQRKSEEAEAVATTLLPLQRQTLGAEHPDVASTMALLAKAQLRQEKLTEAEQTARAALELQQRVIGPSHADTLDTQYLLGRVFYQQHRLEEALASFRRSREGARAALGEEHPLTLAATAAVGITLRYLGRADEAEPVYRRVAELNQERFGASHPTTLRSLRNLVTLLGVLGRYDEQRRVAADLLRREEEHAASAGDEDATALNDYAFDLLRIQPAELQDPEKAERVAERLVELTERQYDGGLVNLARARHRLGDHRGAISLMLEAAQLDDALYLYALEPELGEMYEAIGDLDAYQEFLERHLERRRRMREEDDPLIAYSYRMIGRNELRRGHLEAAERAFRNAVEQLRLRRGGDQPDALLARSELGEALLELGRYDEAEPMVVESFERLKSTPRVITGQVLPSLERVVRLYEATGRTAAAAAARAELEAHRKLSPEATW